MKSNFEFRNVTALFHTLNVTYLPIILPLNATVYPADNCYFVCSKIPILGLSIVLVFLSADQVKPSPI